MFCRKSALWYVILIPKSHIPVESTAAIQLLHDLYLAESKAHIYKYYSSCVFDGFSFQRTLSFAGGKDRLDLSLILSGAVCS